MCGGCGLVTWKIWLNNDCEDDDPRGFLVMMRLVDLQEMIQVDCCSVKWGKNDTSYSEHHADNPDCP